MTNNTLQFSADKRNTYTILKQLMPPGTPPVHGYFVRTCNAENSTGVYLPTNNYDKGNVIARHSVIPLNLLFINP